MKFQVIEDTTGKVFGTFSTWFVAEKVAFNRTRKTRKLHVIRF